MKRAVIYSILLSALWCMVPSAKAAEPVQWILASTKQIVAQPGEFDIRVGDTVVINKNQRYYLSGDTIRKWVYNVCAVVKKVGGQRFPDGILLQDINSWVTPEALSLIGPKRVVEPQPQPVVVEPQPQPQPQPVVVDTPKVAATDTIVEEQPAIVEPAAPVEPVKPAKPAKSVKSAQSAPPSNLFSQHRLSLGVRGGVNSLLQDAKPANCQLGWEALLDVQYAYYGLTAKQHKIGFIIGASAGYSQSGLTLDNYRDQYTATTTDGDIQYTVTADNLKEADSWVTVEVPLMFSLITRGGFFLNIGPKVQIPVYSHYTLSYANPKVDAYFVKERIHATNELITGRLDATEAKGAFAIQKYNLLAALELGYEWRLNNGDALALGAFVDYNAFTFYHKGTQPQYVIDVAAPSATEQPAQVKVNAMNDVYGNKRLFLDCGLKLIYHFVVGKSALK